MAARRRWDLELVDAFKVCRDKDEELFEEAGYDKLKGGQRRLLWHGSVPHSPSFRVSGRR